MLPESVSIAVIEDDPIMGESLNQYLELEGCKVEWWRSGQEALAGLRRGAPDLVICDIRLPDMSGEDIFRKVSGESAAPPFLFMTAYGQIDHAVALIRAGAGDYVTKPFELDDLISRARALIGRRPAVPDGVLGLSQQMRRIEELLARMAGRNTPVLFTGETGSGKEVCARHLHNISDAASRPFVAVNCAAIPDNLLESEVFGHEKGAFTGANSRHLGYAERAQSGTLFLDEVAELPLQLQAKLLRLLDERRFYRLGGEAIVPFRARVVCATNRDLAAEVAAGRFREDLYYRINVVAVAIPPLRERPEDIQLLIHRFFTELASANPDLRGLSSGAESAALAHPWPGNVRELRNRLDRAVALATGPWLMPVDLFPETMRSASQPSGRSLAEARDAAEQQEIERALKDTGGQIAEAAKLLGVSRTTLWDRMRRFGINAV
ncbi:MULTISPECIES: sigma-54 dependent transcriptional regulator [unclassified Bradyrhizobium]|uniref:sigma-54-dependent transcriptional regulator n=1 Tax=unclassified Bradyrhizobium TaxID=2631580 RepID=UPI0028E272C9|nr:MULTISPECIES: sigma-54 dependent transcriptional regulator [unclassified Bradyrhizobium]